MSSQVAPPPPPRRTSITQKRQPLSTVVKKTSTDNGPYPHNNNNNHPSSKPTSPSLGMVVTGERTVKKLRLSKTLTIPEGTTVSDACRRMATRRADAVFLTDSSAVLVVREVGVEREVVVVEEEEGDVEERERKVGGRCGVGSGRRREEGGEKELGERKTKKQKKIGENTTRK